MSLTSALNEVHKGALLLRQPTTSEVRVYFPKRLGNPETHAGKYGVNLGRNGAKLRVSKANGVASGMEPFNACYILRATKWRGQGAEGDDEFLLASG